MLPFNGVKRPCRRSEFRNMEIYLKGNDIISAAFVYMGKNIRWHSSTWGKTHVAANKQLLLKGVWFLPFHVASRTFDLRLTIGWQL